MDSTLPLTVEDTRIIGREAGKMVVLKMSSQCIPFLDFDTSTMDTSDEPAALQSTSKIHAIHQRLQQIVDTYFDGGKQTVVQDLVPSDSSCFQKIYMYGRKRVPRPPRSRIVRCGRTAKGSKEKKTQSATSLLQSKGAVPAVVPRAQAMATSLTQMKPPKQIPAPPPLYSVYNEDGLLDNGTIDLLLNINRPD